MTRLLGGHIRRKRRGAGYLVTEASIELRKLQAQIDDAKVHVADPGRAGVILGSSDQARAKAGSLPCWIDGQQTKVGTGAARFHIDTAADAVVVLGDEELAGRHKIVDRFGVDAIAFDEKALHQKRGVDE